MKKYYADIYHAKTDTRITMYFSIALNLSALPSSAQVGRFLRTPERAFRLSKEIGKHLAQRRLGTHCSTPPCSSSAPPRKPTSTEPKRPSGRRGELTYPA